jgi:hypothetical protein
MERKRGAYVHMNPENIVEEKNSIWPHDRYFLFDGKPLLVHQKYLAS